jgi:hypothetical protein
MARFDGFGPASSRQRHPEPVQAPFRKTLKDLR